jgi:hypothetical protein
MTRHDAKICGRENMGSEKYLVEGRHEKLL